MREADCGSSLSVRGTSTSEPRASCSACLMSTAEQCRIFGLKTPSLAANYGIASRIVCARLVPTNWRFDDVTFGGPMLPASIPTIIDLTHDDLPPAMRRFQAAPQRAGEYTLSRWRRISLEDAGASGAWRKLLRAFPTIPRSAW